MVSSSILWINIELKCVIKLAVSLLIFDSEFYFVGFFELVNEFKMSEFCEIFGAINQYILLSENFQLFDISVKLLNFGNFKV